VLHARQTPPASCGRRRGLSCLELSFDMAEFYRPRRELQKAAPRNFDAFFASKKRQSNFLRCRAAQARPAFAMRGFSRAIPLLQCRNQAAVTKGVHAMTKSIFVKCRPSFELGRVVSTQGALKATTDAQRLHYLGRHSIGDWGVVCPEDAAANDAAVQDESRILSAYPIDPGRPCKGFGDNCLWIITESDRSVTTFLLPSEY
jgi:hypothetical protein